MAKTILYVLGAVFIIIGLLGFVMTGDDGRLLGMFAVDTLHNIIHLASGILALIFASRGEGQARMFALVLGIVYALVTILGLVATRDGQLLGLFDNNGADNILHLVLAIILLAVGMRKSAAGGSMPAAPVQM